MFRFTPRQIEVFLEACRLKSFRRTGDSLRISQAAVSEQIRLLESQLQVVLFNRQRGRIVTLTQEGEHFREAALSFVREGRRLGEMFRKHSPQPIHAFVGAFLLNEYVRPALPRFLTENPDVVLEFDQTLSGSAIDHAIENGHLDCALLSRPEYEPRGPYQRLLTESAYIYANRELRDEAIQSGLASIPFIIWNIPPLNRAYQLQLLASLGIEQPKIHSEVQHHDVATALAASGGGAIVMLQSMSRTLDCNNALLPIAAAGRWERRLYLSEMIEPSLRLLLRDFLNGVAGEVANTLHRS